MEQIHILNLYNVSYMENIFSLVVPDHAKLNFCLMWLPCFLWTSWKDSHRRQSVIYSYGLNPLLQPFDSYITSSDFKVKIWFLLVFLTLILLNS